MWRQGLSGSFPMRLTNLTGLTHISFNVNQLTGSIPAELSQLSALTLLELDNNKFTGTIPAQLSTLSALVFLALENNQLTGSIPAELSQLSVLSRLQVSHNERMSGLLPPLPFAQYTCCWFYDIPFKCPLPKGADSCIHCPEASYPAPMCT
jgi:hypothetical protein